MRSVIRATRYDSNETGSLGRASNMYIRQFEFPNKYSASDVYTQIDLDRICHTHEVARAFEKHGVRGEMSFGSWVRKQHDKTVLACLADIVPHFTKVKPLAAGWTGYRVLLTVHRGNGFPVFHLELFSKHPEGGTIVHSGSNAPNVEQPAIRYNYGGGYGGDWE